MKMNEPIFKQKPKQTFSFRANSDHIYQAKKLKLDLPKTFRQALADAILEAKTMNDEQANLAKRKWKSKIQT